MNKDCPKPIGNTNYPYSLIKISFESSDADIVLLVLLLVYSTRIKLEYFIISSHNSLQLN